MGHPFSHAVCVFWWDGKVDPEEIIVGPVNLGGKVHGVFGMVNQAVHQVQN